MSENVPISVDRFASHHFNRNTDAEEHSVERMIEIMRGCCLGLDSLGDLRKIVRSVKVRSTLPPSGCNPPKDIDPISYEIRMTLVGPTEANKEVSIIVLLD